MNGLLSTLACLSLSALPLFAWQNDVTPQEVGPPPQDPAGPSQFQGELGWNDQLGKRGLPLWQTGQTLSPPYIIAQLWGENSGIAKELFAYPYNFTFFMRKENY